MFVTIQGLNKTGQEIESLDALAPLHVDASHRLRLFHFFQKQVRFNASCFGEKLPGKI